MWQLKKAITGKSLALKDVTNFELHQSLNLRDMLPAATTKTW